MGRIVWTMVSICLVTILLWMMATPGAAPGGPPVLGAPQVPVPRQVPVLLYHDLIPGYHGRNGAVIAVEAFEAQMAWLRENGYTPVTSVELARWVRGEGKLPARPVAIQFDDGYRSNYEHAFPIIARHGMKATIFLVTSSIGHDYLLTPEQIREMAASGLIKFQGHTHRGHETADAQPELRTWTESQVRADHRQMQAEFAAAGLAAPATFAYPRSEERRVG